MAYLWMMLRLAGPAPATSLLFSSLVWSWDKSRKQMWLKASSSLLGREGKGDRSVQWKGEGGPSLQKQGEQIFNFQHWPTQIELKQLKLKKSIIQVTQLTTGPQQSYCSC